MTNFKEAGIKNSNFSRPLHLRPLFIRENFLKQNNLIQL
jgi:hypothetical protein